MRNDPLVRTDWYRRLIRWLAMATLALLFAACGGGGGGGGDVEEDTTPPAPGGSATGADGVPIFWKVLSYNQGFGRLNAVAELDNGSFVVAGFQSVSGSGNQLFVAKTDRSGAASWEKRIALSSEAVAYAVRPLASGGFMVAGTLGSGTAARGFLLKLDADGNALGGWPRTYGDSGTQLRTLLALNGGADGFMLGGLNAGKLYVLRVGADGVVQWARNNYTEFCGGGGSGIATALVATGDGRYTLSGYTGCNQWAGFLVKVEAANGNEVWRRTFDDSDTTQFASLDALIETGDGGLLASGRIGPNCDPGDGSARCDMLVVKTDSAGNASWQRRYGGAEIELGAGVALAADGSYLVAGSTRSYGGAISDRLNAFMWDDLFVVKVAPDGSTQWQKVKGVRPRAVDQASALLRTADGGFAIAGEAGGNPLLVKFDKNGATVDLGPSYDLTLSLPATTGVIGFGNAVEVAGAGASGLLLPPQVGAQLLDLLIAASKGTAPAAYCDGGGTYAFAPAVPSTLAAGGSWTLTFSQCVRSGGGDPVGLQGTVALALNAVSGTPGGSDYSATLTATSIALTVDEPGTSPRLAQTLAGSLRIQRGVAAGNVSDLVDNTVGGTFAVSESSGGVTTRSATMGPFSIRTATPASGALRAATSGDSVTLLVAGQTFTVGVPQPIDLDRTTLEPTGGVYRVIASDGSRLTATLVAAAGSAPASATLAIDTDGDGAVDGSLSVPWDFIY